MTAICFYGMIHYSIANSSIQLYGKYCLGPSSNLHWKIKQMKRKNTEKFRERRKKINGTLGYATDIITYQTANATYSINEIKNIRKLTVFPLAGGNICEKIGTLPVLISHINTSRLFA